MIFKNYFILLSQWPQKTAHHFINLQIHKFTIFIYKNVNIFDAMKVPKTDLENFYVVTCDPTTKFINPIPTI